MKKTFLLAVIGFVLSAQADPDGPMQITKQPSEKGYVLSWAGNYFYHIETSYDTIHWTRLADAVAATNGLVRFIAEPEDGPPSAQFFRYRRLPYPPLLRR